MPRGDIDTLRLTLDSGLIKLAHCQHSYYQIGSATMDLSGLGNVIFGYFSAKFPSASVHNFADLEQFFKEWRLDPADDSNQINLGRAIYSSNQPITASLVNSLIPTNFVSSK